MSFGCFDSRAIFSCQSTQNNPGAKWLQMVDHLTWKTVRESSLRLKFFILVTLTALSALGIQSIVL